MLRLILMRHAKSNWNHPGLADHDRPLNKRGKASAVALGDWMRANDYLPSEVLCSSAQRTGDTVLGLGLESETQIQFTRSLYLSDAHAMRRVLEKATEPTVLMVGHNPGIGEMAELLVQTPPDHDRFDDYPTGATLVCDFDTENWADIKWHTARLVDFVIPRELLAL